MDKYHIYTGRSMLRIFLISIISSVFLIGLVGVVPFNLSQNTYAIVQGSCPNMKYLWDHTYDHRRLVEHKPECVVLEGKMGNIHTGEGDGDLHFSVTPDSKFSDILNKANNGEMVVEIICWDKPGSSYIKQFGNFCEGVDSRSHVPALKAGDHLRVTGKWVQDIGFPTPTHPKWNEIHPAEKIEIIP
jgi:hypothetical protein